MNEDSVWRPFDWSVPRIILITLVGTLFVVLIVGATTSSASFNPYNSNWNGNTEFREMAKANAEFSTETHTTTYSAVDTDSTTSFVFGPEQSYTENETTHIAGFVNQGGLLVVADGSETSGNELLDDIGATARFDGRLLRDNRRSTKTPSLPVATDISRHSTVKKVDSLALNYGTVIDPGTATSIANSSEFSYLAQETNDTISTNTEFRSYPVVAVEQVGAGKIILISDPSIFVNSMLNKADNSVFATNLIEQRPTVMFDVSHSSSVPPLTSVLLTLRSSSIHTAVVMTIFSLVILIGNLLISRDGTVVSYKLTLWTRSTLRGDSRPDVNAGTDSISICSDTEAIKSLLQAQHPEWSEERLERVITETISEEWESDYNE